MHQGLFIAIEGSDGSGKGTQFKLLAERLKAAGYEVSTYDFPQYDQESSYFVREYLNGTYGSAETLGPYTPSVFYALDRFSVAHKIETDLASGKVVLSNRFTGSSMAHQGAKFTTHKERETFFSWIEQLENNMLGIPKPDINVVLLVPADISQELIDQKDTRSYTPKKRDLHEADIDHLNCAVETFEQLVNSYSSFTAINCSKDGHLLSIPSINNNIWERIEPMLGRLRQHHKPQPAQSLTTKMSKKIKGITKAESSFVTPQNLPPNLAKQLNDHLVLVQKSQDELKSYLHTDNGETIRMIMPVLDLETQEHTLQVSELVKANGLQPIKGNNDSQVILIDHWPKNENDIISQALYPHSTISLTEISDKIDTWTYDEKLDFLKNHMKSSNLTQVTYHFELLTSFALYRQFAQYGRQLRQSMSPYYGFDDTEDFNDIRVETLVSQCYESSVKLYQAMLLAGYTSEAEYACLSGHKLKWQLTIGAHDLQKLTEQLLASNTSSTAELRANIVSVLANVHPIVAKSL